MATRPEIADPAVDELKRRARRRLVGAVALALAAAVALPMLLEGDPKPLGGDVSIQIPPIDQGKFVTPLSPGKPDQSAETKAGPSAQPDAPARADSDAAAPNRALPASEQRVLAQPARSPKIMSSAPEAMRPQMAPAARPSAAAKSEATAKSEAAPAGGGALFVQVAALADAKAAAEMATKLNAAGFPARIEPVATPQGPVQRVRVGAYASRDAADTALANLKAAGYASAIVTSQ